MFYVSFLDVKIRQGCLQTVKLICTLMKQVQPNKLSDAIDKIQSVTSEDHFKLAEGELLREVHRLITMYCRSSLTDFSLEPLSVRVACAKIGILGALGTSRNERSSPNA